MGLSMIPALIVYIHLLLLLYFTLRLNPQNLPTILYLAGWVISFTFYLSGIIDYRYKLSLAAAFYLVLANSVWFFAAKVMPFSLLNSQTFEINISYKPWLLLSALYLLTSAMLLGGTLGQLDGISGFFRETRTVHWDSAGSSSLLSNANMLFRSFSLLFIFSVPLLAHRSKPVIICSAIVVTAASMETLSAGGRSLITYLLLGMGVAALIKHMASTQSFSVSTRKLLSSNKGNALLASSFVLFLFVVFPILRIDIERDKIDYSQRLSWKSDAQFGWKLDDYRGGAVNDVFTNFAFGTAYLSMPLDRFEYFYSQDYDASYSLGRFNFPLVDKAITFVSKSSERRAQREGIANALGNSGYLTNPWSTSLRDYQLDFGWFGGLFFLAAVSVVTHVVYFDRNCRGVLGVGIKPLVCVLAFLHAFVSPWAISTVGQAAFLAFILIALNRTLSGPTINRLTSSG
jgi:hypothetical protein